MGSYATSYIKTTSTAVTRTQDIAYKSGISSLVGTDEGAFYYEIAGYTQQSGIGQAFWAYVEDIGGKYLTFYDTVILSTVNGSVQNIGTLPIGTAPFKVAYRWNASFISVFINGVKTNEIAKTAVFNPINFFTVTNATSTMLFQSVLAFPTSISDAECIALTTL